MGPGVPLAFFDGFDDSHIYGVMFDGRRYRIFLLRRSIMSSGFLLLHLVATRVMPALLQHSGLRDILPIMALYVR